MKTTRYTQLLIATLGFIALHTASRAQNTDPVDAPATASARIDPSSPAQKAALASADIASAKWSDIKDCTYDMREQFFAGLKQLEARVDVQIGELNARRAAMKSTVDTKNWDFAMKEMNDSRAYLKSVGEELTKATPETWTQQKETVGLAWVRTQEAYDKVKSSTTS